MSVPFTTPIHLLAVLIYALVLKWSEMADFIPLIILSNLALLSLLIGNISINPEHYDIWVYHTSIWLCGIGASCIVVNEVLCRLHKVTGAMFRILSTVTLGGFLIRTMVDDLINMFIDQIDLEEPNKLPYTYLFAFCLLVVYGLILWRGPNIKDKKRTFVAVIITLFAISLYLGLLPTSLVASSLERNLFTTTIAPIWFAIMNMILLFSFQKFNILQDPVSKFMPNATAKRTIEVEKETISRLSISAKEEERQIKESEMKEKSNLDELLDVSSGTKEEESQEEFSLDHSHFPTINLGRDEFV